MGIKFPTITCPKCKWTGMCINHSCNEKQKELLSLIDKQEEEIRKLNKVAEKYCNIVDDVWIEENQIFRSQISKLREALEFYADPETYLAILFYPDPPNGEFMDDFEEVDKDDYKPGKRARKALEGKGSDR